MAFGCIKRRYFCQTVINTACRSHLYAPQSQ